APLPRYVSRHGRLRALNRNLGLRGNTIGLLGQDWVSFLRRLASGTRLAQCRRLTTEEVPMKLASREGALVFLPGTTSRSRGFVRLSLVVVLAACASEHREELPAAPAGPTGCTNCE